MPFRFHLTRDVFVQHAITRKRLLAGLGTPGARQPHSSLREEGRRSRLRDLRLPERADDDRAGGLRPSPSCCATLARGGRSSIAPVTAGRRPDGTTAPIPVTASDAVAAMLPSPPYRRPVRRPHVEEVTRTSQFHGVLADDELGQRRCAMIAAIPPANRTEIAKASAPHEAVQVVDEVAHFRFIWSFFGSSRVSAVSHRC